MCKRGSGAGVSVACVSVAPAAARYNRTIASRAPDTEIISELSHNCVSTVRVLSVPLECPPRQY